MIIAVAIQEQTEGFAHGLIGNDDITLALVRLWVRRRYVEEVSFMFLVGLKSLTASDFETGNIILIRILGVFHAIANGRNQDCWYKTTKDKSLKGKLGLFFYRM